MSVVVFVPGRPQTVNGERRGSQHWRETRRLTKAVRHDTYLTVIGEKHDFPDPAVITSWPTYENRRSWPDVGAWLPTLKAAVDGLVDAGAWPDDKPEHVRRLIFERPRLGDEIGLVISITPYIESEQP